MGGKEAGTDTEEEEKRSGGGRGGHRVLGERRAIRTKSETTT